MAKSASKAVRSRGRRSGPPLRTTAEARSMRPSGTSPIPADASGIAAPKLATIQVGNRIFRGKPVRLGKRTLDILPDMPDIRDRMYMPHLRALHPAIFPRIAFSIRDQGQDSSCTGFSLAHVIDFLRFREIGPNNPERVNARMLYEMAKRNDEWNGSAYEGSSIRGAIKGFYRNGVCTEAQNAIDGKKWFLTYEMAKSARETRLGAYFRLAPDISDYHAALNDVGVIYVSAQVHSNWDKPENGKIKPGGKPAGGHAFAIVGYDEKGFWVLNSWGESWGQEGIAHWDYIDWAATVMDAWVLQLGVRAPEAFGAVPRVTPSSTSGLFGFGDPARGDIIGHFVNIDDGRLVTDGKYGSPTDEEMQETVKRLTDRGANDGKGYDHLIIYAHGGLNSLVDEAKRIVSWQQNNIFGRNRLYTFHLMWGSGFLDEAFGELSKSPAAGRIGGRFSDWIFEAGPGQELGSYAWRNMKQDARMAFTEETGYDGGFRGLLPLLTGLDKAAPDPKLHKAARRPKLHLVGHSAGSIVLGHLLSALKRFNLNKMELGSIHLMAPACTVEFFTQHYEPYLRDKGALKLQDKMYLYNLPDKLEVEDTVSANVPLLPSYSHSLLYLVSRAYEDALRKPDGESKKQPTPLAGMQLFAKGLPTSSKLSIAYSGSGLTASTSHGGFDNDALTLTTIMSRVLGTKVPKPPTEDEMTGY
jgi:hypothetical protein